MAWTPASKILRWAAWCLGLLLLASFGSAAPDYGPEPVASSVYAAPVAVLDEFYPPVAAPIATPTPEPSPTPTPMPAPSPTQEIEPSLSPPLQPASEPSSDPPPPPPPPPPQPYADNAAAAAIVALTNELRARHGLPPLAVNASLTAAAEGYASLMAASDWFAHEGPDGSTPASRAQAAGYVGLTYLAENLYRGFYGDPHASIVQAWEDSPAHLNAMLSEKATEIGVACSVFGDMRWCVQEFGDR
jgi:uncharacterized protein YkwD